MRLIKFYLLLSVFLFFSCSSSTKKLASFRIGVDPNWYPVHFEAFQPYVNGFVEELLLDISRFAGVELVKVEANSDSLLEGLHQNRYDAVISSLPSHAFYQKTYAFSKNILDLGPVLVSSINAQFSHLHELSHEVVGIVVSDPAFLLLQKYPEIIVRKYETVPELLDTLATGALEGVLLDRLIASSFVRNLYAGKLKIVGEPLTDFGLRLVSLKGESSQLMDLFERNFSRLQKQKKIKTLQAKWQLQ